LTDIILALVTWRIAHLLAHERAPFALLSRFRRAIGIRANAHNELEASNELAELFMCVFCLSVWVGFGIAWLHYRSADFVVYGLAYSAVACVLERVVSK
jgi:hypothetical protein